MPYTMQGNQINLRKAVKGFEKAEYLYRMCERSSKQIVAINQSDGEKQQKRKQYG